MVTSEAASSTTLAARPGTGHVLTSAEAGRAGHVLVDGDLHIPVSNHPNESGMPAPGPRPVAAPFTPAPPTGRRMPRPELAEETLMTTHLSLTVPSPQVWPVSPTPGARPALAIRAPWVAEAPVLQAIWAASQDADDPAFRPRASWWVLADWAATSRLLVEDGLPIGVAAIDYDEPTRLAEARLALLPDHRQPPRGAHLVATAVALARAAGATRLRLAAPATAAWATGPAVDHGFHPIRALHVLLRPAGAAPLAAPAIAGVALRPLRAGEEPAVLAALNRAWAGTWNFRPLSAAALASDLAGHRAGFLLAVDADDDGVIAGTVHALFDPGARNPDGGPYAWLSNLTVDPAWRGRGLGRALLAAGLDHLHARGAGSVALGVDGGEPAPLGLYRSAGFATIGTTALWERKRV